MTARTATGGRRHPVPLLACDAPSGIGIGPAWIEDLGVAADIHQALDEQDRAQALINRRSELAGALSAV